MEIIIPLCMADLIDLGIEAGNMGVVWKYTLALLIFALLELGAGMFSAHIGAKATAGFAINLRLPFPILINSRQPPLSPAWQRM